MIIGNLRVGLNQPHTEYCLVDWKSEPKSTRSLSGGLLIVVKVFVLPNWVNTY